MCKKVKCFISENSKKLPESFPTKKVSHNQTVLLPEIKTYLIQGNENLLTGNERNSHLSVHSGCCSSDKKSTLPLFICAVVFITLELPVCRL